MNLVKKDSRTGTHSGPNEVQSPLSFKSGSFLKLFNVMGKLHDWVELYGAPSEGI